MSGDQIALGPGKVDLLESIDKVGSISEAARQNNISYRRAWDMVNTMNQCFRKPLVESMKSVSSSYSWKSKCDTLNPTCLTS